MKKTYSFLVAVVIMLTAVLSGCSGETDSEALSSWNENSDTKQAIINFVSEVTNENGDGFVPVENRIATFDLDGTLVLEKQLWLELGVAVHRIEKDLSEDAELVALKDMLVEEILSGHETEETSDLIKEVTGRAFQGMTQEDFVAYMSEYMQQNSDGFVDLKYSETFYKPMVELVNYLQSNDFTVYIVSGSERGVIWGAADNVFDLPRSQMIGSDITIEVDGGEEYDKSVYEPGDELVRELGFTQVNLKNNKVYNIYHQIGIQPIFAGGNTDADFSMLNYAVSNPDYPGFALLLKHDDAEREYEYNIDNDWGEKSEQYGWHFVSMKDEFSEMFLKETKHK